MSLHWYFEHVFSFLFVVYLLLLVFYKFWLLLQMCRYQYNWNWSRLLSNIKKSYILCIVYMLYTGNK